MEHLVLSLDRLLSVQALLFQVNVVHLLRFVLQTREDVVRFLEEGTQRVLLHRGRVLASRRHLLHLIRSKQVSDHGRLVHVELLLLDGSDQAIEPRLFTSDREIFDHLAQLVYVHLFFRHIGVLVFSRLPGVMLLVQSAVMRLPGEQKSFKLLLCVLLGLLNAVVVLAPASDVILLEFLPFFLHGSRIFSGAFIFVVDLFLLNNFIEFIFLISARVLGVSEGPSHSPMVDPEILHRGLQLNRVVLLVRHQPVLNAPLFELRFRWRWLSKHERDVIVIFEAVRLVDDIFRFFCLPDVLVAVHLVKHMASAQPRFLRFLSHRLDDRLPVFGVVLSAQLHVLSDGLQIVVRDTCERPVPLDLISFLLSVMLGHRSGVLFYHGGEKHVH
mmetsp:Transcript_8350/g.23226  ORF Transcript_8350/g.23226 Transcript_8350/m.23226 type:complete len:385 (+) Transcript_8350:622-1776(+)